MPQEKRNQVYSWLFFGTGTSGTGVALSLQVANEWGALILKGVSFLSFLCFLLINQYKIENGWKKFKNRFKSKK